MGPREGGSEFSEPKASVGGDEGLSLVDVDWNSIVISGGVGRGFWDYGFANFHFRMQQLDVIRLR